jgi:hypothetical protein
MATRRLIAAILVGWSVILTAGTAAAENGRMAALSEIRVNDEVQGDVVVLAGNVVLGPEARVHGHVVAILGRIDRDPAARVDGRTIAVSSLSGVHLHASDAAAEPLLGVAVRVLSVGGWLLATSIVAFLLPGRVRFGTWLVPALGLKTLVLGAMLYLTLFAALVAMIGLGPGLGVPLIVALAVVFLAARALGLAVLGGRLGIWLLGRWIRRPIPVGIHVFLGVLLLAVLRLLPIVGGPLWIATGVASVGTAVFTLALSPQRGVVRASSS